MAFRKLTKFEVRALKRDANALMDAAKAQLNAAKYEISSRRGTYHIEERCSSGVEVFTPKDKANWCTLFCQEICPDRMTQKAVFQVLMKIKAPRSGVKLEGCVPLDYVHNDVRHVGNVTFALKAVVDKHGEAHIAVHYAVHKIWWRQKYNLPPNQQWKLDLKAKGALSKRSQYLSAEELVSSLQSRMVDVEEKEDAMFMGASKAEHHFNEHEMLFHVSPPQKPTPAPKPKGHRGRQHYTKWSVDQVLRWIYELQMELKIARKTLGTHFREQDIDGKALQTMEQSDLMELGIIDFKDRKKIWKHIADLQRQ